jgi:hypothetical protein
MPWLVLLILMNKSNMNKTVLCQKASCILLEKSGNLCSVEDLQWALACMCVLPEQKWHLLILDHHCLGCVRILDLLGLVKVLILLNQVNMLTMYKVM